eukprot:350583-Chlamydomonas_euryale.AAC.1
MFAILAVVPDRQRTLRELSLGRTLIREPAPGGTAAGVGGTAFRARSAASRTRGTAAGTGGAAADAGGAAAGAVCATAIAGGTAATAGGTAAVYGGALVAVSGDGGRWVIRHGPSDYKTGRHYGERPPLVIPDAAVEPELSAFVQTYRAALGAPSHAFLFTRQNGAPFDGVALTRMFQAAAFRRRCAHAHVPGGRFQGEGVTDSI